jgi:hypothetical protein
LQKVKSEYKALIDKEYNGTVSDVDELINIALALFHEIKVKGISGVVDYIDHDVLLFQYGTYDWGEGNFFEFDITRQFAKPGEDEPYQLHMVLRFDPIDIVSYDCWSMDYDSVDKWKDNILKTEGYKKAKELKCKKFDLFFEQS